LPVVHARDLFHRDGEETEGICRAQIGFGGERKPRQIRKLPQIVRMHTQRSETRAVAAVVGIGVVQSPTQALELQRLEFAALDA